MNAPNPPAGESAPAPDQRIDSQLTEFDPTSGLPLHAGNPRSRDRVPPTISDHQLLRRIGQGAYGEVWLARNVMGTYRAVKIVYRDSFDNDRPYEREFSGIQSFEPISRSHESQVDILHVGRNDAEGCFYYVMELADDANPRRAGVLESGRDEKVPTALNSTTPAPQFADSYQPRTVRSDLKLRGRYSFAEAIEISLALTTALEHLHRHGLIHRDIKPANVIFVNGRPKLADIGLVTETGGTMSFVGTEGYLPPEGPGSVQADIFSLGKTLYEVATGKDRLEFPELPTLTGSPVEEAGLFELNEVLLKACHPDVQKRYRNAADMHADLVLLQAGKSVRRSRAVERRLALLTRVSVAGVILTSLLVAGYFYQQLQTREARRLALENRELAVKEAGERQRAEGLLNTLQSKQAEHYFENDDANKGVAYLARLLRQNPTNQVHASRLMSALTDRSFAAPLGVFESTETVRGAESSRNGRQFVTWGGDGTHGVARIRDARTGQAIGKPMNHSAGVRRARFSLDGSLIATLTEEGNVRIWDGATGEPVGDWLNQPTGPSLYSRFEQVAFGPNGRTLATAGGSEARVWSVPSGQLLIPPLDHGREVSHIQFSPDWRQIATAGGGSVKLWDAANGKLRHAFDGLDGRENLARFSPDGRRLLVAGGFGAGVWDLESGEQVWGHDHGTVVHAANFCPDGVRIVTAASNGAVYVWGAQTGRLLFAPLQHGDQVWDAQFDPTGERLLTREFRRARIWASQNGRPLTEWMLHGKDIQSAQFTTDGGSVLVASEDNTVTLWDTRPGQALNLALRHPTLVPGARFSRDGMRVVTAAGGGVHNWEHTGSCFEAGIWDAHTGELAAPILTVPKGAQYAEFSPDGKRIVTASVSGEAQVWNAKTGSAVTGPMRHHDQLRSARFSPDGRRIVTASGDGTARIWDATTGQPLTEALVHEAVLRSAEFSPNGTLVLTTSSDGARVWDAQTGQLRAPKLSSGEVITAAGFSPDSRYIATGSDKGTVCVWDLKTQEIVGETLKHQDAVRSVRFSQDGQFILTASMDRSARVWHAASGMPVAEPLHHKGPVLSAEFSPDSRRVVTASADRTARVWDVQTSRPLTDWLREEHAAEYAEFSPDGTRVVVAAAYQLARIWQLPAVQLPFPKWLPELAEAVAGQRWTDAEVSELVPPDRYLACRRELLNSKPEGDHGRWMNWLFADRFDRTLSYASPATAPPYGLGFLADSDDALSRRLRLERGLAYGGLRCEWFLNVGGSRLGDLTSHSRFPASPSFVGFPNEFEMPFYGSAGYGVRLAGLIIPPRSGDYRFYLCSDDESALFLSEDQTSERRRQIAHEPNSNARRTWTGTHNRPNQENVSEPVSLEAGRHYYIEALMKNGPLAGSLGVAWQMPGDPPPANLSSPIPGTYLAFPDEWLNAETKSSVAGK